MPELQTFLQKKNDQDAKHCRKKAHRRKTAMFSMAAVGVIPFLAPPLGTDSSVFALAAVADSIDGLYGEDGQIVRDALIAAMIAENEAAAGAKAAVNRETEDAYKEAARRALEELRETTGSILGELALQKDGLHLLELDEPESGRTGQSGGLEMISIGGATSMMKGQTDNILKETDEHKTSSASMALGGAGVKVSAATGEAGIKALAAIGQTGTKAGAAAAQTGTKAVAAAGKSGTKGTVVVKATPEEEAAFFKKIDLSEIPSALTLKYNAGYVALNLSEEQLTVLETIVEAEAGDEDAYGKILVANVVLNRVLDDEFPDTVKEVVFQNNGSTYQFSPVRKGGRYYTVKVSKHTKAAVARALKGEDYSSGALYFFARRYTSQNKATWFDTALRRIVEYGCHEFFGNK